MRLDPSGVHRAGDGLAAAVNQDRVDADGFEEHNVAGNPVAHLRVG